MIHADLAESLTRGGHCPIRPFRSKCPLLSENSLNNTSNNNNNHLTPPPLLSASIMSTSQPTPQSNNANVASAAASAAASLVSGLAAAQPQPPPNGQLQAASLGSIKLENPGLLSTSYYATSGPTVQSFASSTGSGSAANEHLLNAVSYGKLFLPMRS